MKPYRTHHCRGCKRESRQVYTHTDNGIGRAIENWRCVDCSMGFVTMQNVKDAHGLVLHILHPIYRRSNPPEPWREEAELELMKDLLVLYREKWKPERQASFKAFATWKLPKCLVEWDRRQKGRETPKAHHVAESLDALISDGDRTAIDALPGRPDPEAAAVESRINPKTLTPRARMYLNIVASNAFANDLTLNEATERMGWTKSQLNRGKSALYEEIREDVA